MISFATVLNLSFWFATKMLLLIPVSALIDLALLFLLFPIPSFCPDFEPAQFPVLVLSPSQVFLVLIQREMESGEHLDDLHLEFLILTMLLAFLWMDLLLAKVSAVRFLGFLRSLGSVIGFLDSLALVAIGPFVSSWFFLGVYNIACLLIYSNLETGGDILS